MSATGLRSGLYQPRSHDQALLSRQNTTMSSSQMADTLKVTPHTVAFSSSDEVVFEKVLWRKQAYADNFVAPSFLCDLRTNSQVVLPSLGQLTLASLRISTRLLRVVLLALWFVHLHLGTVDAEHVLLVGGGIVALSTLVSSAYSVQTVRTIETTRHHGRKVMGKVIMAVVLLAVSPVLRTLTESTTSDSIWALSVMLFLVHLTLADYSGRATWSERGSAISDTMSFNAAMSASVVLASRLNKDSETFTLLALGTLLFVPKARASVAERGANKNSDWYAFVIAYSMTVVTAALFAFVRLPEVRIGASNRFIGIVLVWTHLVVGFISIVCPWWIVRAQTWKMEIKGPWDPAEPVLSSSKHPRSL